MTIYQIAYVYTTCTLEQSRITLFQLWASHHEHDVRGKWQPCDYGIFYYREWLEKWNNIKLQIRERCKFGFMSQQSQDNRFSHSIYITTPVKIKISSFKFIMDLLEAVMKKIRPRNFRKCRQLNNNFQLCEKTIHCSSNFPIGQSSSKNIGKP